jgi:hypothetical protein
MSMIVNYVMELAKVLLYNLTLASFKSLVAKLT